MSSVSTLDSMDLGSVDSYNSLEGSNSTKWLPEYKRVRNAIAHLLLHPRLHGVLYTSEQLVTPLNFLGGVYGRDEVMMMSEGIIKQAFSRCGEEFCEPYCAMGIKKGRPSTWSAAWG